MYTVIAIQLVLLREDIQDHVKWCVLVLEMLIYKEIGNSD